MVTISNEIETALIDGQNFMRTGKIKEAINDFHSNTINRSDLFFLGVELGRLYEYECEHSTRGNGFEGDVFTIITEIEKSLR